MNFTYVGIQVWKRRGLRFAALLVNQPGGYTVCQVYYTSRHPVRIVYLEGET